MWCLQPQVDPSSHWLAAIAHASNAPGGRDVVSLFAVELQSNGIVRDIADLGSSERIPAAAPVAWATGSTADISTRMVFAAPVAAAANANPGPLDLFAALQVSAPSLGLFVTDLSPNNLEATQPRRVGTATNLLAPLSRPDGTVLALGRRGDVLTLSTVDVETGKAQDLAVQLPTDTALGSSGIAGRWDDNRGRMLLVSHMAAAFGSNTAGGPIQAWLVSFVPAPSATR
jgi:hypothetical protein